MKKIICLLAIALSLAACTSNDGPTSITDPNTPGGSSTDQPVMPGETPKHPIPQSKWEGNWNDENDPAYKPQYKGIYNPIEGDWKVFEQNGKPYSEYLALRFELDLTWSIAPYKPEKDKFPSYRMVDHMEINNTSFRSRNEGLIYQYQVSGNGDNRVLTLFDGSTVWKLRPYDNEGRWEWKDDWNHPEDPHFKIYNGKYNPIKGLWKMTHEDGQPTKDILHYLFTDNFDWKEPYRHRLVGKYCINDTGFQNLRNFEYYQYTIVGDTLNIIGKSKGTYGVLLKFVRVIE